MFFFWVENAVSLLVLCPSIENFLIQTNISASMGERKFARILVNGVQVDGLKWLVVIQVIWICQSWIFFKSCHLSCYISSWFSTWLLSWFVWIILGQQEMILGACAPRCANGCILAMRTCGKSMKKIPEIWKLVDGMMTSGRRLD